MILIPDGEVIVSNIFDISPSLGPGETCSYYSFVTHPRFGTIEASDVESRLFLAGLYAASSMRLPDPRWRGICNGLAPTMYCDEIFD
jgi:hypothetical protein